MDSGLASSLPLDIALLFFFFCLVRTFMLTLLPSSKISHFSIIAHSFPHSLVSSLRSCPSLLNPTRFFFLPFLYRIIILFTLPLTPRPPVSSSMLASLSFHSLFYFFLHIPPVRHPARPVLSTASPGWHPPAPSSLYQSRCLRVCAALRGS